MSTATPATGSLSVSPVNVACPRQASLFVASMSLWRREIVRFFRQRNRVVGSIATPFVFWVLLGFGLNRNFEHMLPAAGDGQAASQGYLAYFYPGTITLVLLFTAIFSNISIIEDRSEGFMQGILVAPVSRLAIVLGKVFGGATIATIQGMIFLIAWPLIAPWPGIGMMLGALVVMFILAMALSALGFCFAWPCSSTAGFHAIMNLILMPMWFLSGAMFPVTQAPLPMRIIMFANPLTYGQELLSKLMAGQLQGAVLPVGVLFAISVVMMVVLIAMACRMVSKLPRGSR
jgi:ABC-2 type transport system permease protein